MKPGACARIRLAAIVLPAWLLAGCEGDGTAAPQSVAEYPVAIRSQPVQTAPPPEYDQRAEDLREAVRDLGLVDPMQDVRLDVASEALGELSIEQFEIALQDESPEVRQEAIDALLGAPEAVVLSRLAQLRYAMTDPDESVRESVVAVLGVSGDPRVISLLLQARGDESPIVREEAREALAAIKAYQEVPEHIFSHGSD